jgi:hypothetical protein
LVIITDWPPTLTQLTEAGFAIPAVPVEAVAWVVGIVAGVVVVVGTGEDDWVQPARTMQAATQNPRTRITENPDFIIQID